jgi:hypothetical protein
MRLRLAALALPLVLAACGGSDSAGSDPPVVDVGDLGGAGEDASGDVKVTDCRRDERGLVTAALTITNSAPESKSYLVTVSADGPDDQRVADIIGLTGAVSPGQSVMVDATGAASGDDVPEDLTCTVVKVTRS